jgi:lysozyme
VNATERAAIRGWLYRLEDYKQFPYRCSEGALSIGIGRNLDANGIDLEEARYLLDRDIARCEADLSSFAWYASLDRLRRRALINMRFQLGPTRFRGFTKMIAALAAGDYETASTEALDSLWARQTTQRALEVATMLRTGKEA